MANRLTEGQWEWPDHLDLLSRKLVDCAAGRCKRLIITLPPQNGKSSLASHWFPVWFLNLFPDRRIVFVSYGAEYAESWGRRVRNSIDEHAGNLTVRVASDNGAAGEWETTEGGGMVSVGVGGSVTGRRADLLVFDDPIKNAEEANSETHRRKVWEFFQSAAYTRLTPNGAIIIIMCMVGDTPVLMADGTEKALKDVRPGDAVASYNNGRLSSSTVRNWANQGPDFVYEIRMKSGITVKANERHPFLVVRNTEPEWIRLRNLRIGDRILKATSTGASGEALCVPAKGVASPQNAGAFACPTTTKQGGKAGIDHPQLTLSRDAKPECGIGTKSIPLSIKNFSLLKTEDARSAVSCRQQMFVPTGAANYASITTTNREELEGCSATTAISCLGTERLKERYSRALNTYEIDSDTIIEIVAAGREDVFDIQVDDTENFIANGLISHNTRWHEDDLVGMIDRMEVAGGEHWERLNLPAIAEENDPMGRAPGAPLWPARWPMESLVKIKAAIGSYFWSALYGQRPAPPEGNYFKRAWFEIIDANRVPRDLDCVRSWDLAATASGENGNDDPDWLVGCKMGVDPSGVYYIQHVRREQVSARGVEVSITQQASIDNECRIRIEQEGAASGKIVGSYFTRLLDGYDARFVPVPRSSKFTRSGPFNAACERGDVKLVAGAWVDVFLDELAAFPNGSHDDQVDAAVGAYTELSGGVREWTQNDWQKVLGPRQPQKLTPREMLLARVRGTRR